MKTLNITVFVMFMLVCLASAAYPQRLGLDSGTGTPDFSGGGYWAAWDPTQERLIFRRDVDDPASAGVRVVNRDGTSIALFPGRDFSGSQFVDIWDAAAAPDGDIVISAVIGYGSKKAGRIPTRLVVLTYDSSGTLRKVWETKPYHIHLLAPDSEGNVFAFGHSDNASDETPLFLKYSTQGEVLKGFLAAKTFSAKGDVAHTPSETGENRLFFADSRLYLFVALSRELFVFSPDGALLSRASLVGAF